ncbi:hypothetical protein KJ972_04645 [Candidatus Micrarchaeota archaeon]|nr:hypothetical protein [Candidatus Micrarchaeota archaeon]
MGLGNGIKRVWHALEDPYYGVLEWLDAKHIPVFGIIDPIDRVLPSLLVWIIIIVGILFVVGGNALPSEMVSNQLFFVDSQGNPLEGVSARLESETGIQTLVSNENGEIVFSFPISSRFFVIATKAGFNELEESFRIGENGLNEQVEMTSLMEIEFFEIRFLGMDNQVIQGKELVFSLACSNPSVSPIQTEFTINSEDAVRVSQPQNCGGLVLTLFSPSDFRLTSYPISVFNPLVLLEPASIVFQSHEARLNVFLSATNPSLLEGTQATVVLFRDNRFEKEAPALGGVAHFSGLTPGVYSILVLEENQLFGQTILEGVVLEPSQEKTTTIMVSDAVVTTIRVQIVQSETTIGIENALVRLVNRENGKVLGQTHTKTDGITELGFVQAIEGSIYIAVSAPNFFSKTIALESITETQIVELKPISAIETGTVIVKVENENQGPIENARVFLLDAVSKQVRQDIPIQFSDALGKVTFLGVPSEQLVAWAEKDLKRGESPSFQASTTQTTTITTTVKPDQTLISILALDHQGIPVGSAIVTVFNAQNQKITSFALDTDGSGITTLTANQRVSLEIKHEDFMTFRSETLELLGGIPKQVNAVLERKETLNSFGISFQGFQDVSQKEVTQFFPGTQYYAVFDLSIPKNPAYIQAGAFFRIGGLEGTMKNAVWIESIQVANAVIVQGKSFDPANGENIDLAAENLVTKESKWAQVLFSTPTPGTQRMVIGFKARTDTTPETMGKFFYNAWAITQQNQSLETNPIDTSAMSGSKERLYATAYHQSFSISGKQDSCENEICFANFFVKNLSTTGFLQEPFELNNNHLYELSFELANNSTQGIEITYFLLANMQDSISTSQIKIQEYSITLPDKSVIQESAEAFESNSVSFSLGANQKARVKVTLQPSASYWSSIVISAQLDSGETFKKSIPFEVSGERAFKWFLSQHQFSPLTENSVQLVVLDEGAQTPVENAIITIRLFSPNGGQIEWTQYTDSQGKTDITISAKPPNTQLWIAIRKNGFNTTIIKKEIALLLVFSPETLEAVLGKEKINATLPFSISNESALSFEAKNPYLNGSFAGVLNLDELENQFSDFTGTLVTAFEEKSTDFFGVQLAENYSLEQNQDFRGSLMLSFLGTELENEYLFSIPVTIHALGTFGIVNGEESCLVIEPTTWNASTQQNQASKTIRIRNECQTENNESIHFDFLKAKINWLGEEFGNIEISISSDILESPISATLKSNEWTTLFEGFFEGFQYDALLIFTPKEESLGETAQFEVWFSGSKQGLSPVLAEPLETTILIANLEECLVFQPKPFEGIVIPFGGQESFSIDSSLCGNLELDISLCQDDPGCTGGATKGQISLFPTEFSLHPGSPQTITVSGVDLPGSYGIEVDVKTSETGFAHVTTMEVIVENDPTRFFALDKFEFFVKNNGKDSATLTNSHVSKMVSISALSSDWQGIPAPGEEGMDSAQAAGDGLDPAAIEEIDPALGASNNIARDLALFTADGLDQARETSDQALGQTNTAAEETESAQDSVGDALDGAGKGVGLAQMITTDCAPLKTCAGTPLSLIACPPGVAQAGQICAAAQSVFGGITGGVEQPLTEAMDSAQNAANAMGSGATAIASPDNSIRPNNAFFSAVLEKVWLQGGGGNAVGSATQAENEIEQSRTNAAVGVSAQTSSGANSASQQASSSCQSSDRASQFDQQAQQDSDDSSGYQGDGLMGLGMNITQAIMFESAIAASCLQTTCSGPITKMRQSFYTFKGVQTSLQAGSASIDASQSATDDKAIPAQQQAEQASQAASQAACEASNRLRDFAAATDVISNDSGGASGDVQETITNAGPMQGALNGMNSGIYENEIVTNRLHGFLINLVNDAKEIQSDNPKINGEFNTDVAKVSDHYQEQEVGVVFENKGLEEEKPVYSTVTIIAAEHAYGEPQSVPPGQQDWGAFNLESIGTTSDYAQEFHLKFNPSEQAEAGAPVSTTATSCVQGARIGQTGEEALPKVKLSWDWESISQNACDASNVNYFYCDGTQFAIMVSKRLRALEEFLQTNAGLPCPTNPYQVQLDNQMNSFDPFVGGIGHSSFDTHAFVTDCWLDPNTRLMDGKASLEYFVEEASNNVAWTSEIKNAGDLHELLFFDVYLIQDGFSTDFLKDFSHFYTFINFSDTPAYFYRDAVGKNYNQYFENEKISFQEKFSNSSQLPTSGLYHAELIIDFGADWQFFDTSGHANANIQVNLLAQEQAESSNPFYYLPFDGGVGFEDTQLKREGYGVRFNVSEEDVFSISNETKTRTWSSPSSSGIQNLSIDRTASLESLNARFANRGIVLDLKSESNSQKNMAFTPSLATPLILKIQKEETSPFSVFFLVRKAMQPETTGSNLGYWTGMGETCKDYSGETVQDIFKESADRKAGEDDQQDSSRWQESYAIDWENPSRTGMVFLKSIFYTPPSVQYSIESSGEHNWFYSLDSTPSTSFDLQGISDMTYNSGIGTETQRITALNDLFELVQKESICITNSGLRTIYWWNTDALYSSTGSQGKSMNEIESDIESQCIH